MNYFIFNYETDSCLITSFLESAALAHNYPDIKTIDWFYWKFKENPYGEAILACAEDNGKIVGCVAYGIQPFWLNGKKIKGVLSFETFVHPLYQGKGIFGELIKLGEETIKSKEIDLMLNFPNLNSLNGFLKNGWVQIESPEYWIKGRNLLTVPLNIKNIRQSFKSNNFNIILHDAPTDFEQSPSRLLNSLITSDYLKWRFFTYPVSEYVVIDADNFYSIIRMGYRSDIREGQVLFINIKNKNKFSISDFLKQCKQQSKYDILSFSITKNNSLRTLLMKSFFLKVPNKTNICYKILNDKQISNKDVEMLSLSAINYHTY